MKDPQDYIDPEDYCCEVCGLPLTEEADVEVGDNGRARIVRCVLGADSVNRLTH